MFTLLCPLLVVFTLILISIIHFVFWKKLRTSENFDSDLFTCGFFHFQKCNVIVRIRSVFEVNAPGLVRVTNNRFSPLFPQQVLFCGERGPRRRAERLELATSIPKTHLSFGITTYLIQSLLIIVLLPGETFSTFQFCIFSASSVCI